MSLLVSVLNEPALVRSLNSRAWDVLIRQARHANLLGRLYQHLNSSGELPGISQRPLNHLVSGATMADRQHLSIKHEIGFLQDTFNRQGLPLILLKGAAYVLAGLPAASGRVFADIDILVPQAHLADAESALMLTGWVSTALDPYDQRYYRQWMHELPAMQHMFRGTALDVHHTILPPTSRLKPDPDLLIDASIELPEFPGVRILCPADMVLHSATHLFHEGEPDNLLRDLTDLDALLRHFAIEEGFWERLAIRAKQLHLGMPLELALYYTSRLLATPVPLEILQAMQLWQNRSLRQQFLDAIYLRAFRPQHETTADWFSPAARWLLYIRAHWLRMPPHLLAYHLGHKVLFPAQIVSVQLTDDNNQI